MFSVTVDNVEYKVEFQHWNPANPNCRKVSIPGTDCHIFDSDGENRIGFGDTELHPLDHNSYNKNIGRKLSLYRALMSAFPEDKETRRKFWQAYYEARGKW